MDFIKHLTSGILLTTCVPLFLAGQNAGQKEHSGFGLRENLHTKMVSRLFTSYELDANRFHMLKFSMTPEFKLRVSKNLRLTSIVRLNTELGDHLEPGRPEQQSSSSFSKRLLIGDRSEIELRELYFDYRPGPKFNLRLGKQQIVWGETDGIKLLDVVNPQNFREFLLEDFEDSRIPLWAIKAEFPIYDLNFELVWVPDLTYHHIPEFGSAFFPKALFPAPPQGNSFILKAAKKPDHVVLDSDIGVKISKFVGGWDLTINYFYHYDDLPVLVTKLEENDHEHYLSVQPQYNRMHTIGGTFNTVVGPLAVRGEMALNLNRHFTAEIMEGPAKVVKSNQFLTAFGLDWFFGERMVSFQFFSDFLLKNEPIFNRKRLDLHMSLLASQELLNDDLKLQIQWIQNVKNGDGMLRPEISYFLRSNVKMVFGSDIFYGSTRGLFGQFRERSRIFLGLEWGI